MSLKRMDLWPGVYLIKTPIPALGAFPGDFVCVDPTDENPFILTRVLDQHEAEAMLGHLGAAEAVSPSFSSPSWQRSVSSWRRARRLRLET